MNDKAKCYNQRFGHNFLITGGDCQNCGINQKELSNPNSKNKTAEVDMLDSLLSRMKKRREERHWQPTMYQQDAIDTATALGDMESKGIYLGIFKRYRWQRIKLLECKDWCLKNGKTKNKGRLFVKVYQKFLK